MPTFIRELAMDPDDERRLAVRPEHRDHARELFEAGQVRMSGPLADGTGAFIVYRADSLEAARELVATDPYTREGVVRELSLREWTVVFPSD